MNWFAKDYLAVNLKHCKPLDPQIFESRLFSEFYPKYPESFYFYAEHAYSKKNSIYILFGRPSELPEH